MVAKGIAPEFAERVFEQIRGFGEYGFPESHAASFALIAYATAWLKCHYPAEFACALLNAQPMGFYSPSTIVEDAQRHGVEVRPVDVRASDWDCTLESVEARTLFAVRLGLRYVKGLSGTEGERIVAARRAGEFLSLADFTRRVRPGRDVLQALAEAGAFDGFESSRRTALWEAKALAKCREDPLPLERSAPDRHFARLSPAETIRWDYRTTDLSPRGHPLEAVRAGLRAQGLPDAAAVAQLPHGRRVRYAGAVICRQQPGTAKGVVFLTLEDETGFVNVVLWPKVWTKYRVLVKTSPILGVTGRLESQQGVAHLIAESGLDPAVRGVRADGRQPGLPVTQRTRTLTPTICVIIM